MKAHVCPWWLGYFLINPLRKFIHNPYKILGEYIKPGIKLIDYGSAMGYFSLPMAKMTGPIGKVYCFDIQAKMLSKLMKRATNANVHSIIEPILIANSDQDHAGLNGSIDFALLFAVAHEVPDQEKLFVFLAGKLKKNGYMLFAEPSGHVSYDKFIRSVSLAEKAGFKVHNTLSIKRSYSVLLKK